MADYKATVEAASWEMSAREKLRYTDFTDVIQIDEATQAGDIIIDVDKWVVVMVHNEKSDTIEASRANPPTPGLRARRLAACPREKVGQTGLADASPLPCPMTSKKGHTVWSTQTAESEPPHGASAAPSSAREITSPLS